METYHCALSIVAAAKTDSVALNAKREIDQAWGIEKLTEGRGDEKGFCGVTAQGFI
jgi:hypothetical protein